MDNIGNSGNVDNVCNFGDVSRKKHSPLNVDNVGNVVNVCNAGDVLNAGILPKPHTPECK